MARKAHTDPTPKLHLKVVKKKIYPAPNRERDKMLSLLMVLFFLSIKIVINTIVTAIVCVGVFLGIHKLKDVGYGIVVLLLMFFGTLCLMAVCIVLDIYFSTNVKSIIF